MYKKTLKLLPPKMHIFGGVGGGRKTSLDVFRYAKTKRRLVVFNIRLYRISSIEALIFPCIQGHTEKILKKYSQPTAFFRG